MKKSTRGNPTFNDPEKARQSQLASAASRKRNVVKKKTLAFLMEWLLDKDAPPAIRATLQKLNLTDEEGNLTNRVAITVGLIQKAIKGDVQAYNAIRDIIGEKPVTKLSTETPPINITVSGQQTATALQTALKAADTDMDADDKDF